MMHDKKVGLLVVMLVLLMAATAAAQSDPRQLHVVGRASARIEPDRASVSVGVELQADTARKAQDMLASKAASVIDALVAQGLERKYLKTGSYNIYPIYVTKDKRQVLAGYAANTEIRMELENPRAVAGMLDAAMAAGATSVGQIRFYRYDMSSITDQLIMDACEDARRKALAATSALGARLGGPLSISIQDGSVMRRESDAMMLKAVAAAPEASIEPGLIDVQVSIDVTFLIFAVD
ncbi:MAG: SIMPL domain-containing protein [Rectinemataceae bacterium]